ncbi:hypothetical protein GGI07_000350 [Coemansia sp. Benny D115]|nr:hypothetical protein GGI07_000350 [Coemansia sp. Benny D115]
MTVSAYICELNSHAHARLFIKHILQARRCRDSDVDYQPETTKGTHVDSLPTAPRLALCIDDHIAGATHELRFDRVRVIGTVVSQGSAGSNGSDMFYIDDGTGAIPFTLDVHEGNRKDSNVKGEAADGSHEKQQIVGRSMRMRLTLSEEPQSCSLVGQTVEVLGILQFVTRAQGQLSPMAWIQCSQINLKPDPMAEALAFSEILSVYGYYFSQHTMFKNKAVGDQMASAGAGSRGTGSHCRDLPCRTQPAQLSTPQLQLCTLDSEAANILDTDENQQILDSLDGVGHTTGL